MSLYAYDDLRALLPRDSAERERIAALLATIAIHEQHTHQRLSSVCTPLLVQALDAHHLSEPLTHWGGETWL